MAVAPRASLIGRAHELELLLGWLEAVRDGRSVTALIEGEGGIGKTRLLTALLDAARTTGVTVFRGEAHALERTRPFGPLIGALDLRAGARDPRRAAIGRLVEGREPPAAEPEHALPQLRFDVAEEIVDLLEVLSDRGPLLVALEDLHWADSSTLVAFRWMAQRLDHVPLLLVATLRPSPRGRELEQVVDGVLSGGAGLIRLGALSDEEVDALVSSELGVVPGPTCARAMRRAGGNPLWIVEMLRSLSAEGMLDLSGGAVEVTTADLPESLRQLVLRRLGYLPEATAELMRIASILGSTFSLVELAAMTGRNAVDLFGALEEAFRARLIGEQGAAVVFRHALVHEAVYRSVPEPARVALHREAAHTLSARGAPPEAVASHAFLGAVTGDLEAVALLRRAAREAGLHSPEVSVELLRRAESLLPDRHPKRDDVMVELVGALMRVGEVAQAASLAEAVLARPHDVTADRPLRLSLIEALSLQNRPLELIAQGEATLTEARALSPADQALVLAQISYGRTFSGDLGGGEDAARRALSVAEGHGDTVMTVWSLTTLSVAVKLQGRYGEAIELTERALHLAFDPPDDTARARNPHFFRGLALGDADQMDEAAAAFRTAIAECDALGSAWILPDARLMAAELRFLTGEWDVAIPELEAGLQGAAEQGALILVTQSLGYLALIAAARGDRRGAKASLDGIAAGLDSERPYGAQIAALATALLAETEGESEQAFETLLGAWRRDVSHGTVYYHRHLGPWLVRLALARDDAALAAEVTAAVSTAAALAPGVPSVRSAALRCRGLVDRDAAALLESVELAGRSRRILDHAGSCEDAAAVLAADARIDDARAILNEAIDRYEQIGAKALAARTASALRAIGGRRGSRGPRQREETGWESLTPSERAVAELVAQGLTNREVARRLYISPHTVNTHLRHVFRRLDVRTRAALAAKVHAFE